MSADQLASADDSCPICLDTPENIAMALDCRHKFCYACISEWTSTHNQCPFCRQPIHHIRRKLRNDQGDEVIYDESVIASGVVTEPLFINIGSILLVMTPDDSMLFVIEPIRFPNHLTRYHIQTLDSGNTYYLRNVPQGTLFVRPSELIPLVNMLESHGITIYSPEQHSLRYPHSSPFHMHAAHVREIEP